MAKMPQRSGDLYPLHLADQAPLLNPATSKNNWLSTASCAGHMFQSHAVTEINTIPTEKSSLLSPRTKWQYRTNEQILAAVARDALGVADAAQSRKS